MLFSRFLGLLLVVSLVYQAKANKFTVDMKKGKLIRPEQVSGPLKQEEQFLQKIGMIESSGGIDTDHKEMQSGIHAGTSAVGQFGLMPETIRELARRVKRNDPLLGLEKGYTDPELEQWADPQYDNELVQYALENSPDLQLRSARLMKRLVENRYQDPEKMAYAWNQGHNTPSAKITPEKLDQAEYVRRFRKLRDQMLTKK